MTKFSYEKGAVQKVWIILSSCCCAETQESRKRSDDEVCFKLTFELKNKRHCEASESDVTFIPVPKSPSYNVMDNFSISLYWQWCWFQDYTKELSASKEIFSDSGQFASNSWLPLNIWGKLQSLTKFTTFLNILSTTAPRPFTFVLVVYRTRIRHDFERKVLLADHSASHIVLITGMEQQSLLRDLLPKGFDGYPWMCWTIQLLLEEVPWRTPTPSTSAVEESRSSWSWSQPQELGCKMCTPRHHYSRESRNNLLLFVHFGLSIQPTYHSVQMQEQEVPLVQGEGSDWRRVSSKHCSWYFCFGSRWDGPRTCDHGSVLSDVSGRERKRIEGTVRGGWAWQGSRT